MKPLKLTDWIEPTKTTPKIARSWTIDGSLRYGIPVIPDEKVKLEAGAKEISKSLHGTYWDRPLSMEMARLEAMERRIQKKKSKSLGGISMIKRFSFFILCGLAVV